MADPEQRAPAPAAGAPVAVACRQAVDDLRAGWDRCGAYLLLDGRLRCVAGAGRFQVLDGLVPPAGPIGRAVATGRTVVADDVPVEETGDADVTSMVCAPVVLDGACVGAVTIEGTQPLGPAAVTAAEGAATALVQALGDAGGLPRTLLGQQLAHLALDISAAPDGERLRRIAVEGATRLAGTSSAALVDLSPGGAWQVACTTGPLAQALSEWDQAELAVLSTTVRVGAAGHVAGDAPVPASHEFLTRAGVRSLGTQPLVVGGALVGLLLVADEGPRPHDPVAVAALEVLTALTAGALRSVDLLADLAARGREALAGLPGADEFRDDLTDECISAIRSGQVTHTSMLLRPMSAATDEVLATLAEALLGQLRHGDSLFRTADQEFAILLATGQPQSAAAVADRLDRAARAVGAPVALGWALVDGPPSVVTAATVGSLESAGVPAHPA